MRIEWWKILLIAMGYLLFWTFIVCYPNPYVFIRNFIRYIHFPVDPSVIELVKNEVPQNPAEIEEFVLSLVEYEFDWSNYGAPWYVPTARDAVTRRKGDCESRAIVLASLLEAKNIPYNLKASLVHIWVDYPGKKPSKSENVNMAYIENVNGKYRLKLPDLSQWRRYLGIEKEMFWDAMPGLRKSLMVSGWILIVFAGCLFSVKHGRRKRSDSA